MTIEQSRPMRHRRGGPLLSVGELAKQIAESRMGGPRRIAVRDLRIGDVVTLTPADCGCRWAVASVRRAEDCWVIEISPVGGGLGTWFSDSPESLINLVDGPRVGPLAQATTEETTIDE